MNYNEFYFNFNIVWEFYLPPIVMVADHHVQIIILTARKM